MKYESIPVWSRTEIDDAISGDDIDGICKAILSFALYQDDWREAQDLCLKSLQRPEFDIKRCALIALGHIVRLNGQLDLDRVELEIERFAPDYVLSGHIEDLRGDIEIFRGKGAVVSGG